jgi:hypothetical protein
MSLKRALPLTGLVLALVAFAMPAGASATTTITDNGVAINETIEATGEWEYQILGTGYKCTEVRSKIAVNGDSVDVTAFEVLNPHTKCTFFGSTYGPCKFEPTGTPVATNLPWGVDIIENKDEATITKSTNAGTPNGVIDYELEAKGAEPCTVTTNDITIVHEAGPPAIGVTIDLETNASGFIEGLKFTGKIKIDAGPPAAGTTTPSASHALSTASIAGTLKLAKPNTYKLN